MMEAFPGCPSAKDASNLQAPGVWGCACACAIAADPVGKVMKRFGGIAVTSPVAIKCSWKCPLELRIKLGVLILIVVERK